jgi:hypothetical protein
MFFVLSDAWVLCLCLYDEDDTLIAQIVHGAKIFADRTSVEISRTKLKTALRGR